MTAAEYLSIAFRLLQNGALLALGVIGYCQIRPWLQIALRAKRLELCIYGLAFGVLGVISMLASIDAGGGVRLDLRNAIIATVTVLGGVTAGTVATAVAALYRLYLGGGGLVGGIVALLLTYALSIADLLYLRRRSAPVDIGNLAWLGIAVGVAGLTLPFLFTQPAIVQHVVGDVAPVWIIAIPLTIVFLGTIICHFERSRVLGAALREREGELRAILDNAPIAIFFKDRLGRYRLVNRCYEDWAGVKAEQILGRTDAEAFPPELARLHVETDVDVLRAGRPTQLERSSWRTVPNVEYLLTTKFPIRDAAGTIVGLAGFILDITDRQRAEETLRRSEERFRALIENANDIVSILRPDGTVIYRSPTIAEGLGRRGEMDGRSVFPLVHPDDEAPLRATLAEVGAQPQGHATGRSRLRHKDGSWRHIAWTMRNAADIPGVNGIIVNWFDITDNQRLEEQLLQAQKTDALGRLAGGIAHDFNNILGAILGFAGFLVQDLPKASPEHGFAERIVSAGERARDLVRQILAFSRRVEIKREPHDLGRLLRETQDLLRASVAKSARLDVNIDPGELVADVNPAQVSQILLNLVINANDALAGEPGTISVGLARVPAGEIAHRWGRDDAEASIGAIEAGRAYARLSVADTGVGMEAALLQNIFDPFFTTKERGRGTGLGLAVVQGVVAGYGGAMTVSSRRGRGSVFTVYLPLSAAAMPAAASASPAAEANLRGRERVLVIDDEGDIRDMLSVGLERLGYEVVALGDPQLAEEAIAEHPDGWDVVISDEVMPGMRGVTLFQRLRQINPRLHFILCTGFSGNTTADTARRAGIDAFFIKPVSTEQLAACIRSLADASAPVRPAI